MRKIPKEGVDSFIDKKNFEKVKFSASYESVGQL